jgi:hypothetical protein
MQISPPKELDKMFFQGQLKYDKLSCFRAIAGHVARHFLIADQPDKFEL